MLEAIRVVEVSPLAFAISTETMVKSAAATVTHTLVRMPAGRRRTVRSAPMTEPSNAAQPSR